MNSKRTDVGYRRPPIEHRFKKGQKPPPRKPKPVVEDDLDDMFWRVLQEPRRIMRGGKAKWVATSELLVRRAYHEAQKGSSTLSRLVNDQLLKAYKPEDEDAYEIVHLNEDGTIKATYPWPPKKK